MSNVQKISAQISLYPLGNNQYNAIIDDVLTLIQSKKIHSEINVMSTILNGEASIIFPLLAEIHTLLSQANQKYVLNVTISNTCGCEI